MFRKTVVLFLAALLFAALLSEVGARLASVFVQSLDDLFDSHDPLGAMVEPVGQNGYRQKPNSQFRYLTGAVATSNAIGYRGPVVAVPKPAGVFRVVLLGGSSTHGWGVTDDQTLDAKMRGLLGDLGSGRRYEVVNLAFDGYDSRADLERFQVDGLRLAPDLVIVNGAINDVRNAQFQDLKDPDPRTILHASVIERLRKNRERGRPLYGDRFKHYSYLARLPGIVMTVRKRGDELETRRQVTPNPQAFDLFQRNLERLTDLAAAASIPVILAPSPSSLPFKYQPSDFSSVRAYWIVDAATTQRVRDVLAARMKLVARTEAARGRQVAYLAPPALASDDFFDDCHLTPSGNGKLAAHFVDAVHHVQVTLRRAKRDPVRSVGSVRAAVSLSR